MVRRGSPAKGLYGGGFSLKDRLLQKIKKDDYDPINGCWIFTGAKTGRERAQYGILAYEGGQIYAHHAAFICLTTADEVPKGMVIMHICDVPLCCNPKHLRLGTYKDNHRDMLLKGRSLNPKYANAIVPPTKPSLMNSDFGRKFPEPDDTIDPEYIPTIRRR
jgi:hypothetical protein